MRDQLRVSESNKKQAQQDAHESKEQLFALSVKLEQSEQQLLKLSATEQTRVTEHQKVTEEHEKARKSELEAAQKQLSDEIQQLKVQLELVANCENAHTQIAESSDAELLNLKHNLSESLSLVENMKNQLPNCKDSTQAQALVNETLRQLEAAKRTVEFLRADADKAVHGYNSAALELDQSRKLVNSLEALVGKLESSLISNKCSHSSNFAGNGNLEQKGERLEKGDNNPNNHIETEIHSLRSEVGLLRHAIEIAETKYQEEQIRNIVKIRSAHELIEQIKSESSQRESELERKSAEIEELKAKLMDKETKLQGVVDENQKLNMKLAKSMLSPQREQELKKELRKLDECVAELRGDLMDKETTLQSISEENEMLKVEINKRFTRVGKVREEVDAELGAAKAAERDAFMKLGIMMEEAERSKRKATRVAEQLEAAEAANSVIEAELRRVKVQCDQWRKAAEAATAMLSAGNNGKITERSLSLDNNYNMMLEDKYSALCEEIDDDFQRKKNGNVLKKIGVLWKKPQKVNV